MPPRAVANTSGASAASRGTSPAAGSDAPAAPRRSPTSLAGLAQIEAQQQRARAATVMQAGGGGPVANAFAFLRGNPVMMFASVAVLAGLLFGIYVYLQIAKPGLFVRQVATKPQDTAPPPPPAAPPAAPAVPSGLPETASPGGPAVVGAPPETMAAQAAPPAAGPSASGTIAAPVAPPPAAPGPVLSSSVVASAPPMDSPRTAGERPPETRAERSTARAERQSEPRVAPVMEAAAPSRERISVSASGTQPRLNPLLTQAYSQLQSGSIEEARATYNRVNQAEPLNTDALLGLAYIASQENRTEDAMKHYLRILQLNPRHAVAQGAMIGLMGRADPAASESRLKQLIAREPSAFLHFSLGNLYADQSQWTQAQQSYFQAHHLEPDNPDYAYNLAVGLDHLRQNKLALNYYRRAEQLATGQGRSNFNLAHARERIRALTTQLE
jgi:Flp pilus assembly protein TadD